MATKGQSVQKQKRLKKKNTPPEVWIAHRKARKKVASAKWYAKKKKDEIKQQNTKRQQLEQLHQERLRIPLWTHTQFCEWRSATEYHNHGWPIRPVDLSPVDWCTLLDLGYEAMERIPSSYTQNPLERLSLQQMCMRELLMHYRSHGLPATCDRVHRTSVMARDTNSSRSNDSTSPIWERARNALVSQWFPMVCSELGLLFLHVVSLQQTHRWRALCQYLRNRTHWTEQIPSTTRTHNEQPPHSIPPTQNPTRNDTNSIPPHEEENDEEWDEEIQRILDDVDWWNVEEAENNHPPPVVTSDQQRSLDLSIRDGSH